MLVSLAVMQVISGVVLGAISFLPSLHKNGGLSQKGWIVFGLGSMILIGSTVSVQVLSARAEDEAQKRIEDLMKLIADTVMTTTKGPAQQPPPPTGEAVRILEPPDGDLVESTHVVRGRISDSVAQLWVVVHPLATSSYWVQPRVSIRRGGEWQVQAYFGRSGSMDVGKTFEVLAIVDPATELREGMILERWPASRLVSDMVSVTRK